MVRDQIKDREYFDLFILEDSNRVKRFTEKLRNGEVKEERILAVKTKIHDLKLGILIAHYSNGEDLIQIKEECSSLFDEWLEVWEPNFYIKNLWLMSLGVLLNIDDTKFDVIRNVLSQSGIEDWLYEVLLNYKKKNLKVMPRKLIFPEIYHQLEDIIYAKENQIDLLKNYIQNDWYTNHKDCGWYDSHKGSQNTYYGYWSFESGAIAKILRLNDEKLKYQNYYPYDLVHFNN